MGKQLKITQRSVKDINPAPYNPRDISDHAFEGLKKSLEKFGFVDPLIVNKRNDVLVGGHQRLKAAIALGYKTVPVVEVDLSPVEEKALNITLNNQKISGHYTDALQVLLQEIKVELPDDDFADLHLDELVIDDNWTSGFEDVEKTDPNLDGLRAVIRLKCPQEVKEDLVREIKSVIANNSKLIGVEFV